MPLQWRDWATFKAMEFHPFKAARAAGLRLDDSSKGGAKGAGKSKGSAEERERSRSRNWGLEKDGAGLNGWTAELGGFLNPRGTGMLRCWGRFLVEPGCQDVREGCLQAIGELLITWASGKMGEQRPRMLPRCRYLVRDSRVVLCSVSTRSEQVVLLRCCSSPHQLHNLHLSASLTSFAWETRHGLGTAAMRNLRAVLSVGSHLYGLQWRLRSTAGGVNMFLGSSWASKHNE